MKRIRANEADVKLLGRTTADKEGTVWCALSGTGMEFRYKGTQLAVALRGDDLTKITDLEQLEELREVEDVENPRFAVYINEKRVLDQVLCDRNRECPIWESSEPEEITVKILKLSEAPMSLLGIAALLTEENGTIQKTPDRAHKIEFIGDSITCGYGVDDENEEHSFSTATEDVTAAYAYLTAQTLGADYSMVSYSGYGIISGYTETDEKLLTELVPDMYEYVGYSRGKAEGEAISLRKWTFESFQPDVVVINLGTNDSSYLSQDFDGRKDEFTAAYTAFLKQVREKNPKAAIICTMGTMGGEDLYPLIQQAITDYTAETGDSQVRSYQSATQKPANGLGSDWHPSALTHELSAYVLADQICTAIGREWSKIGLDAAPDGIYDVKINTEAGANAAHYVGYDKSFWINMVDGGTKPEDIQAYVGGLTLTPGTYELAFDYTSTVDVAVTYGVQQLEDPEQSCVSGSIDATGTKQHAAKTFTITEPVEDAAIVFNLGGTDYYNITLSDITLFKKA